MTTTRRWLRAAARAGALVLLAGAGTAGLATGTAGAATAPSRVTPQTWAVQKLPALPDPFGSLSLVSCPAATFCMATGPVTATWNGSTWTKVAPASPPTFSPVGLSCASATFCVAIGEQITGVEEDEPAAATWTGKSWKLSHTWTFGGELNAVSCTSASACLAVGTEETGADATDLPVAERWNGTQWTQPTIQGRSSLKYGTLTAVSCSAATACTAVGTVHTDPHRPLTLRWNGTSLAQQQTAQPTKPVAPLIAVSCPAAAGCISAGEGTGAAYLQIWHGSSWTTMTAPALPGRLASLSCTAITSCLGVGTATSGGKSEPFAARLSGTTWTVQRPGTPAGQGASLSSVSCVTASNCLAVGAYENSAETTKSLAERWNGTKWTAQLPPNGGYTSLSGELTGAGCATAAACAAVGDLSASGTNIIPLSGARSGGTWKLSAAPAALGPDTQPASVSCPTATLCLAVGYYYPAATPSRPYPWAAAWNGKQWRTVNPPHPSGSAPAATLTAVSCASATYCVAVGGTGADTRQLSYSWNGSTWKQLPPAPHNTGSDPSGVSCVSATFCVAVGGFGATPWFAETWNGTAWTIAHTSGGPQINAVSCSSATACTAVGSSETGEQGAIERWNGTAWTAQKPALAGAGLNDVELNSVSCAAATDCTTVGDGQDNQQQGVPIIQAWNGTNWVAERVPATSDTDLNAVSCVTAADCLTVGAQDASSFALPLAETSG